MRTSLEGLLSPEQIAPDPVRDFGRGPGIQSATRTGRWAIIPGLEMNAPADHSRERATLSLAHSYFASGDYVRALHTAEALTGPASLAVSVSGALQNVEAALNKMDAGPFSVSREKVFRFFSRKAKLPQKAICFRETHHGTVTEILDDEVEVTYDLPEGPLKQIYRRDQFLDGNVPKEGAEIEAQIIVSLIPSRKKKAKTGSELPEFNNRAESGTVRL